MGSPVVAASPRKSPCSGRRLNKPLVEKKRRARINGCLGQLKSLILSAMQSEQGSQVSRLEKADILEMTVKYLRHVQRHQASAVATSEPEVVAKFSAGYTECATEVIRYMDSVQCVAPEVRSRLESHLVERLRGSVPTGATVTTVCGNAPVPASFPGMSANNQTSVSEVYGRHVSSTTSIHEEMHRHYQTAVDLANMAAAVTAKEEVKPVMGVPATTALNQPQSFHRPTRPVSELSLVGAPPPGVHMAFGMVVPPKCIAANEMYSNIDRYHSKSADIVRSHSISPSHFPPNEIPVSMVTPTSSESHENQIRQCSEPGLSQMAYSLPAKRSASEELNICRNSDVNNNYTNYRENRLVTNTTASTNINDYLSTFQRPLHIHIPDSVSSQHQQPTPSPPFLPDSPSPPSPQPTPSPPFLHPHVGYPHGTEQSHQTTLVSLAIGTAHDLPPTILYGYAEYQTGIANNAGVDFTTMYPTQYNTNSSIAIRATNNSDIMVYNDNISRESTDRSQSQARNNFTNSHLKTISNYHTDFQGHLSLPHGTRTTPSPPTLSPEETYISDRSDQYYANNYPNVSSQDFSANSDFRASLPAVLSPNVKENYDPQSIRSRRQSNPNGQYSCNQYHQLPGYSYQGQGNLTTTSTVKQTRNCPAEQSPGNGLADNGQRGMKGPCQTLSAPSRQNDIPLSPPTLKKRLLLAQGSEGEWTTPRCNGVNTDKRHIQHDTGRNTSEREAEPRFWRHGHETQAQLSRGTDSLLTGPLFCSAPVHVVTADEGLWRPW